jgi:Ca2+-binding RTX toxin-like protein
MPKDIQGFCVGTANADTMTGTAGQELMFGLGRNDILRGLEGEDLLDGGTNTDTLNGGPNNDHYLFQDSWGNDTIADGSGSDDRLNFGHYTQGGVTVDMIPSSSRPEAFSGTNTVDWPSTVSIESAQGSTGNDIIQGTNSANTLTGYGGILHPNNVEGNDTLNGRGGDDKVDGGPGDDRLTGGRGRDVIWGDGCTTVYGPCSGNDVIHVEDFESDTVYCGPGFDTVFYDFVLDRFPNNDCEDKRRLILGDPLA